MTIGSTRAHRARKARSWAGLVAPWYGAYALAGLLVNGLVPVLLPLTAAPRGPLVVSTVVAAFFAGQLTAPLIGGFADRRGLQRVVFLGSFPVMAVGAVVLGARRSDGSLDRRCRSRWSGRRRRADDGQRVRRRGAPAPGLGSAHRLVPHGVRSRSGRRPAHRRHLRQRSTGARLDRQWRRDPRRDVRRSHRSAASTPGRRASPQGRGRAAVGVSSTSSAAGSGCSC